MMPRMFLLIACLGTACNAPSSFQGSVAGKSLQVRSSIFAIGAPAGPLAALNPNIAGAIVLTDAPNPCSDAKAGRLAAKATYLVLGLAKPNSATLAPATYLTVDAQSLTNAAGSTTALDLQLNGAALVSFYAGDAQCNNSVAANLSLGVDGTVTVGAIQSGGQAFGSYDVAMGPASARLHGLFNATWCPALLPFLQNNPQLLQNGPTAPPCR